jgi:hypothetical protein
MAGQLPIDIGRHQQIKGFGEVVSRAEIETLVPVEVCQRRPRHLLPGLAGEHGQRCSPDCPLRVLDAADHRQGAHAIAEGLFELAQQPDRGRKNQESRHATQVQARDHDQFIGLQLEPCVRHLDPP